MNRNHSTISIFAAALAAATVMFSTAIVQANDVFLLKFSGSGRYQGTKNFTNGDSIDVGATQGFTSQNLINLAMGNAPGTKVPANIVLALESDCSGGASIIVYNTTATTGSNVVADIADVSLADQALDTQKEVCTGKGEDQTCDQPTISAEYLVEFMINQVGDSGNESIDSGDLVIYAKATLNADSGCPTAISATGMGSLGFSFTDKQGDPVSVTLLVTKATLSTGKLIGTL